MHLEALIKILVLVTVANAVPVLAKRLFENRLAYPVDGNLKWFDGNPLFGSSKTVRGIVLSLAATAAAAPLLGLQVGTGLLAAASAMAGDLLSSFTKRRLGLAPSSRATGLDQIPEALLPLLTCSWALGLNALDIVVGVAVFMIGGMALSRVFYRLRLRDRPY
jgi:CDP-diglyceride synthetase